MHRTRLVGLALTGLFLVSLIWESFPAAAQGGVIGLPPAPVTVTVQPEEDGYVVYAPITKSTSDDSGSPDGAHMVIKLLIKNNSNANLLLQKTLVKFDGPPFVIGEAFDTGEVIAPGATQTVFLQDSVNYPDNTYSFKLPEPPPPHVFIEIRFAGYASVKLVRPLKPYHNDAPGGSYLFPAKTSDLNPGEFWGGSSNSIGSLTIHRNDERFAYDMGVIRWNTTTGKWTGKEFDAKSPTKEKSGDKKEDYLVWNKPVYAIARGEVIKITRDKADHDPGGENVGANQVQIRVNNEIVQYLHFRQNSIPQTLQEGDIVFAGQFLGRVGQSGKSSNPHLHIDVVRTPGSHLRPLLFHNIYVIERTELDPGNIAGSPWVAVHGKSLPWVKDVIWPSNVPPQ